MQIKLVHAHFLITLGDYSNERVGFTAVLEEGDTIESAVAEMRKQAIAAVGPKASHFYDKKRQLESENRILEQKINKLRSEWDATAEFLRTQGIKPEAPSMPQFQNLLAAVRIESESVEAEIVEPDPDDIPFNSGDTSNSGSMSPDNF